MSDQTLVSISMQKSSAIADPAVAVRGELSRNTEEARELHAAAIGLFQSGRLVEAREKITQAIQREENCVRWNDFATIALGGNDFKAAEWGYRRAVEMDSCNAQAATNLSCFLERFKNPDPDALRAAAEAKAFLDAFHAQVVTPAPQAEATILGRIRAQEPIDATTPEFLRGAIQGGFNYTGYFVRGAVEILRDLPVEEQNATLAEIETVARDESKFKVLAGVLYMIREDYPAAVRWLREAMIALPNDVFTADALLESLALSPENGPENLRARELPAYLAEHTCPEPWKHIELLDNKRAYLCCPGWLPVSVGAVPRESCQQIWHSEGAAALRASVQDGSFRFCHKFHCPSIASRSLPPKQEESNIVAAAQAKDAPAMVALSYDTSCNLACPQCRRDFKTANRAELQDMETVFTPWIEDGLARVDVLRLNGAGDVFGSKHSRSLLRRVTRDRYPNLKFQIITNGQLFDERAYKELDLAGRIELLQISIDAATPKTYEILRPGGSFARLLKNIEFLDCLRTSGQDSFELQLMYVVSSHNYGEMPEFVRLAKRFHAQQVVFTTVRAGNGLTVAEAEAWSVYHPGHPQHEEYLKILEAPELQDRIVAGSLPARS